MTVWLATPGVLALILLMALTSVAVVVFFVRLASHQRPSRLIIAASAVAAVLLSITMYLLISNVALMTGSSGVINIACAVAPFVVLLAGVVATRRRRSSRQPVPAPVDSASVASGALRLTEEKQ